MICFTSNLINPLSQFELHFKSGINTLLVFIAIIVIFILFLYITTSNSIHIIQYVLDNINTIVKQLVSDEKTGDIKLFLFGQHANFILLLILGCNLLGLIPYSFTITSSLFFTFTISLIYFIAFLYTSIIIKGSYL
jgi:F-type H+-transporting ATPase subunit a